MAKSRQSSAIPKRFQPYLRTARAGAELQYGSQQGLLEMLLADEGNTLGRSIAQAQGGARIMERGIQQARAGLDQNLQAAGLNMQALAGTPDGRRVSQTYANALNELTLRDQQADEYAASGVRQARENYGENFRKIAGQLTQLAKERGLYTANAFEQMVEGDRNARRTARSEIRKQEFEATENALDRASRTETSLIGQGIAPDGSIIPGSKADPRKDQPKFKWSETEQRKASDTIEKALSYVRKADPGKGDARARRSAIARTLVEGVSGAPDPLTGRTVGGVPALPAIYVSAALDLHFGQALGRKTVQRLHDRGVKIKPLGYPTATRPRKHKRPGTSSGGGGGPHGTGRL